MWNKTDKAEIEIKLFVTVIFAVIFGNYITFCLDYPQVCTENMRYCVPLIFVGAYTLGRINMKAKPKGTKAIYKYISKISVAEMMSMLYLSVFVYMAMMFYEA